MLAPPSPRADFKAGALAMAPALVAMIPFALILGQQAAAKGISSAEMLAMSSLVFAGSSQFLAIGLWSDPVPVAAITLATLLINLRHVLLGASLAGKIAGWPAPMRFAALFLMADETWAVAERRALSHPLTPAYYFGAGLALYVNWQILTTAGTVVGGWVPDPERLGFDFAFPAIFIGLAIGFWKGLGRTGPVILAAGAVSIAVHALVPGAWYVLAGAFAGILAAVVATPADPRGEAA